MSTIKLKTELISKKINHLNDCPRSLYIKSELKDPLKIFNQPTVAVVGSRKLTSYGKAVTEKIVAELVSKGVVIVSGLALGIDSVAHSQALQSGGSTIAVLPCGVNSVYPRSHLNLADTIVKNGALISEYQPDEKIAYKQNFIARNRIIAGLSDIIFIPEAASGSGSLHTAQFGIDLGIDIFAAPGSIFSPSSVGTNSLIKTGAYLLDSAEQILQTLGIKAHKKPRQLPLLDSQEQMQIVELLLNGPVHFENIVLKTKLSTAAVNSNLSMLEILGIIKNIGNNNWDLK